MLGNSIFITIDTDWASDEVLEYTIDMLEENNVKATFFFTHETALLNRLYNSSLFEIGIHPNFQYILNGISEFANMRQALDAIMKVVPMAVSVRSHCLVQSSPLLELFFQSGLRYDVNLFLPWYSSMVLKPFTLPNGLTRVPFFWEDDIQCTTSQRPQGWDANQMLKSKGLKIFNFHPIHLFLNTENIKRYEQAKIYHNDFEKLKEFRFLGESGTCSFFSNVLNLAKKRNMEFKLIRDIQR